MKHLKRIFTLGLILSFLNIYLPTVAFAKADITIHEPEIISTPGEKIPATEVKKKTSPWVWVVGIAAVGGLVAAAAGGGGGDDGGGSGTTTGSITVGW